MEEKIELKEKKIRSEKQIEAFQKAQQIRKEGLKIKREKINEIKKLPMGQVLTPTNNDTVVKPIEPIQQQQQQQQEEESDDDEPEIVYIKKEKPKKKKKKKIIIESSSSSSDEEVVHLRKSKIKPPVKVESKEIMYKFI